MQEDVRDVVKIPKKRRARETALKEIHVLAPKAKVFVLGYPEITPASGTCPGFESGRKATCSGSVR